MQVIIRSQDRAQFKRLCESYPDPASTHVQDLVMATAPDRQDSCSRYSVPDHTALATWISLAQPHWIEPAGPNCFTTNLKGFK